MRADARRNRELVIDAGARLLAERPGASMQEIADASGLGRTTVYRHFPAREDLIAALVTQVAKEAAALSTAAMATEGAATDGLRRLAVDAVAFGHRFAFLRSAREEVRQAMADSDREFSEWVRAAQDRDELRSDVDAVWILVATRGLIQAAIDASEHLGGTERAGQVLGDTLIAAFGPR